MKHYTGVFTIVAFLSITPAVVLQAVNNVWTNPAGGLWEGTTNWNQGRVPISTDALQFGASGSYTVTVSSSAANTVPNSFSNSGLDLPQASSAATPTLLLNYTNPITFQVNGTMNIGNSTLTMNAPNGTFAVGTVFMNGPGGFGTSSALSIQSGTFTESAGFYAAYVANSLATINIATGGILRLSGISRIGNFGSSQININGGILSASLSQIGYVAGGTGRVVMTSGSLILTNTGGVVFGIGSGEFDSGNHGYGELIISNGSVFTSSEQIEIGSGQLAAGGGGVGVMKVFGGVHTNFGFIDVGHSINSSGTALLAGGTWNSGAAWKLGVSSNSFGSLTITNDAAYTGIGTGGQIQIGPGNYSTAQFNMAGGSVLFTNSIGATSDAWIEVGSASNSIANLNVSDGLIRIRNNGARLLIGTGNSVFGATTTNAAGTAAVTLTGGRVELFRITTTGDGVLSNRTGGLIQFLGADIVSGSPSSLIVDGGTLSYKGYTTPLNVTGSVAKFTIASGSGLQLDNSDRKSVVGTYLLTNGAG